MSKKVTTIGRDEAVGKTVSGIAIDGSRMLIAFTDGKVLALTSEADYDGATSIDVHGWSGQELDLMTYTWFDWFDCAEDAGLITHEEWEQVLAEHKAAKAKHLRAELERLEAHK